MARRSDSTELIDVDEPVDWVDREDPYEDVHTEQLPDWWSEAVTELREHDMRPYKPPRFTDDVIVPPLVERLESVYDVEIRFSGIGAQYGDLWDIYIDGEAVLSVAWERTSDGDIRYGITSSEFESVVRDYMH